MLVENGSIHGPTFYVEGGRNGFYYIDFGIVVAGSRDLAYWRLVLVFRYCDRLGVFEDILIDIVCSWGWIISIQE